MLTYRFFVYIIKIEKALRRRQLMGRKDKSDENMSFKVVLALIVILIITVVVLAVMLALTGKKTPHTSTESVEVSHNIDNKSYTLSDGAMPYEVNVKFGDALLKEAKQDKKLIIMTQEVVMPYTAESEGFIKLDAFSKSQGMVFYGKAEYTVDLSDLGTDSFEVDNENKKITIHIPRPEAEVNFQPGKAKFFDTSNGILSFGQLKLTNEQHNELENVALGLLRSKVASDEESRQTAERYARLSVKEIYEPVIRQMENAAVKAENNPLAIAPHYEVEVVTDSEPSAETTTQKK